MPNKIFQEGNEFFKSNELTETGQLLQKAIPTMPVKKAPPLAEYNPPTKEVPESVKNFKAKVEGLFKEVDKIIEDMKNELTEWDSSYFCEQYWSFKKVFQQKLNNIIMYPLSPETKERIKKENEGKVKIV